MFQEIKYIEYQGIMNFKKFSELKKKLFWNSGSQDWFLKLLCHDDTHPIRFIQVLSKDIKIGILWCFSINVKPLVFLAIWS